MEKFTYQKLDEAITEWYCTYEGSYTAIEDACGDDIAYQIYPPEGAIGIVQHEGSLCWKIAYRHEQLIELREEIKLAGQNIEELTIGHEPLSASEKNEIIKECDRLITALSKYEAQ